MLWQSSALIAEPFDEFKENLDKIEAEQDKLLFVRETAAEVSNWPTNDQGRFHHQRGLVLEVNDQIEAAKEAFTLSIQTFEQAETPNGFWVKSLLDRSYMDYLLTYDEEIYCVDRQTAVEIARKTEEPDALCGALVQLAFCHQHGFESFQIGLSLLEEATSVAQENNLTADMTAMIHNATGNLYRNNLIHDKAYEYYQNAYDHWSLLGDKQDMFNMLHTMIGESIKLGKWEQANNHLNQMFALAENSPDFSDFNFFAYYNQAILAYYQNQFEAATNSANMALELAHTTSEQYFIRGLQGFRIVALFRSEQHEKAGELAAEFLKISDIADSQKTLTKKVELIFSYTTGNYSGAISELWALLDESETAKKSFTKNAVAMQSVAFDQTISQFQEQALESKLTISQLELEKQTKQSTINQLTGIAAALLAAVFIVISFYLFRSRQFYLRNSRTDFLTRCHNRRRIFELGHEALENHKEKLWPLSVAIMDIDDFKAINDQYGHDLGDQVLVSLVSKVNDLLTANQQIGRMGGEEFMLLFPNTNPEEAKQHAEKIRIAINKTNTFYHGSVVKFTVSIGVFGTPDKNQTLEQMVKQADLALYSAKNSGKNQVTLQAVHERD